MLVWSTADVCQFGGPAVFPFFCFKHRFVVATVPCVSFWRCCWKHRELPRMVGFVRREPPKKNITSSADGNPLWLGCGFEPLVFCGG